MKQAAEIGVILPGVRERLEPEVREQESGRPEEGRKESSLEPSDGAQPC